MGLYEHLYLIMMLLQREDFCEHLGQSRVEHKVASIYGVVVLAVNRIILPLDKISFHALHSIQ